MTDDEAKLLQAALDLVEQIQLSDYRDRLGHPLKNNTAYLVLVALLAGRGLLKP